LLQNGDFAKALPWPWNHPLYGKNVVSLGVDPKGGVGGTPCLYIEGKVPRGMREWYQNVKDGIPKGRPVTLTVQVRTEKVTGAAWVQIAAKKGIRFLSAATTRWAHPLSGDTPWKRLVLTFQVPKEADLLQVSAVLEGKGKAYFDNFLLVPGSAPGNLPSGSSGGGEEGSSSRAPVPSARKGGRGKNGVFLVRYSLEMRALKEEKQGRLYVALPAVRKGQLPFYFKVESMPADGIRSIKVFRKWGRKSPPFLELRIFPMKAGEKVKIDMETKVLVLAGPPGGPLPESLGKRPKFPGKVKPYLTPSRLLRSVQDQASRLAGTLEGKTGPARILPALTGAARKVRDPALALALALRNAGIPARLVSGVSPSPGPTRPSLAVEAWIPGREWVLLLPGPAIVEPPAWRFLCFREIPKDQETKRSRLFPGMPFMGFLEAKGNYRVRGMKDPRKGAYLECMEALPLPAPPKGLLPVLVKDLRKNWARWLEAREKGREDPDAEFAGETASQTKDFQEMVRILEGK